MASTRANIWLVLFLLTSLPVACGQDSDGDGLLDVIDVKGFDPSMRGSLSLESKRIEDLDGINLLTNLKSLSLASNRITRIENGDLHGLANLQSLDLSSNGIDRVESRAFEGLTNLADLSLIGNQINRIDRGDFTGLTNLNNLWLVGNPIADLESGAFGGLTNLQKLILSENQITSIERGTFEGLNSLQRLELVFNPTTRIERGAFEGLTNLQTLLLWENQISSIEGGDFHGLPNLRALALDGNSIASIKDGAFETLTNLRSLSLVGNSITKIHDGAFNGLVNLRSLSLFSNHITELNLSGATFDSVTSCDLPRLSGFCIDRQTTTTVILDDAELSLEAFNAILGETESVIEVSLDGLRFTDRTPTDLRALLDIETLRRVTVDRFLYRLFPDEFDAFNSIDGNTVSVVSFDCNSDGAINILDANCTPDQKLDRFLHEHNTVRGDLDGMRGVQFADFLALANHFGSSPAAYTDGDLDRDGSIGLLDFELLAENFGRGHDFDVRVVTAPVPEPSAVTLLIQASWGLMRRRRKSIHVSSPPTV